MNRSVPGIKVIKKHKEHAEEPEVAAARFNRQKEKKRKAERQKVLNANALNGLPALIPATVVLFLVVLVGCCF